MSEHTKSTILIVVFLVVLPLLAFQVANNSQKAQQSYDNQIAACERGNDLREIIFANTRTAARENKGTAVGLSFARNLKKLKDIPGANPITGAVDCESVIENPELKIIPFG